MAKLLRTLRLIATCIALVFAPARWEAACCACDETAVVDEESDGTTSVSSDDNDHESPCSDECQSCCGCCGRAVAVATKVPSSLFGPGAPARSGATQRAPPRVEPEELLQVPKTT